MITQITGRLVRLRETSATLAVGAFEYQVMIPEICRRQLQSKLDQEISLTTIEYIDGNPQKGGRMVPRLVGFLNDAERDFFDLICQVDGVGVKKALQAMVRPVQDFAIAIEEQDTKTLSTLPGIGPAVAERIIAKLRRKMAKFALLISSALPEDQSTRDVLNEGYEALIALGHSQVDAREKIETIMKAGKKFKGVDELLQELYRQNRAT